MTSSMSDVLFGSGAEGFLGELAVRLEVGMSREVHTPMVLVFVILPLHMFRYIIG